MIPMGLGKTWNIEKLAGGPGIEPGQPDPESVFCSFFAVPQISLQFQKASIDRVFML